MPGRSELRITERTVDALTVEGKDTVPRAHWAFNGPPKKTVLGDLPGNG